MRPAHRILGAIVLVCLLPVAIPVGLHAAGWRPSGHAEGEVLQPVRALPTRFADAEGHWRLVVAGSGPCDAECTRLLDVARRIHVALYKQMPQVRRMWIGDEAHAVDADRARLLQAQPDLRVDALDGQDRRALDLDQPGHRLYLVDPQGRVVMRYGPQRDEALFQSARKDLTRLLRYS